MKLHQLSRVTRTNPTRVGRGTSGKRGKTAGRGTKGQKARSGYSHRAGFEGGQNPLVRRIPKLKGFHSRAPATQLIKTKQLNKFNTGSKIDKNTLISAGLIKNAKLPAKIVFNGAVKKQLTVTVNAISAKAKDSIVKAGGKVGKITSPSGRDGTSKK